MLLSIHHYGTCLVILFLLPEICAATANPGDRRRYGKGRDSPTARCFSVNYCDARLFSPPCWLSHKSLGYFIGCGCNRLFYYGRSLERNLTRHPRYFLIILGMLVQYSFALACGSVAQTFLKRLFNIFCKNRSARNYFTGYHVHFEPFPVDRSAAKNCKTVCRTDCELLFLQHCTAVLGFINIRVDSDAAGKTRLPSGARKRTKTSCCACHGRR